MAHRKLTRTALAIAAGPLMCTVVARADGDNNTLVPNNKRLNDGVVANVYTAQHQAGCSNDVRISPQLQLAAQRQTRDVLNNPNLNGDIGSDGSMPQDRANAAGYHGAVAETVATNPALAISGVEVLNQWYYNSADFAIMSDCANSQIGVWSENSLSRSVVVAVYGRPEGTKPAPSTTLATGSRLPMDQQENIPIGPSPDYDASDEIEYGISWFPWILRGAYPPPGMPPQ